MKEPDLDWDIAASYDACEDSGVVVPEFESPLCSDGLRALELLLNSTGPNIPVKELYLLCREFVSTNNRKKKKKNTPSIKTVLHSDFILH